MEILRTTNCVECEKEIDKDKDPLYFTHSLGKYLCEKCGEKKSK